MKGMVTWWAILRHHTCMLFPVFHYYYFFLSENRVLKHPPSSAKSTLFLTFLPFLETRTTLKCKLLRSWRIQRSVCSKNKELQSNPYFKLILLSTNLQNYVIEVIEEWMSLRVVESKRIGSNNDFKSRKCWNYSWGDSYQF